jgi:hypothetical protein
MVTWAMGTAVEATETACTAETTWIAETTEKSPSAGAEGSAVGLGSVTSRTGADGIGWILRSGSGVVPE